MLTNVLSRNADQFDGHQFDGHLPHPSHRALLLRPHRRPAPEIKAPAARRPQPYPKAEIVGPLVAIAPANHVKRRIANWSSMTAEIVQATSTERTEFHYAGPCHLLVLFEQGVRRDGETAIEGLPSSSLRDLTRKLIFVPAGRNYRDWHEARSAARMVFFYLDPEAMPSVSDAWSRELTPRGFFEDATLLSTAQKLASLIESADSDNRSYLEALGLVLTHELVRMQQGSPQTKQMVRGGLAAWQQRIVTAYIEEHLAESIPLATLAGLASLSTYHFCRAFKQSFGLPPHRYHTSRRIDRAKTLLAKPAVSVTDIGLTVGFSETSSFTAAFRKATGLTPSAYHRSLV
jgi:AraC family transcriptional regulator